MRLASRSYYLSQSLHHNYSCAKLPLRAFGTSITRRKIKFGRPHVVSTPLTTMASDQDYLAFLDKANQDVSGGAQQVNAQGGGSVQFKTVDSGTQVPVEIRDAVQNAFYVSDADEPFEGVSLRWDGEDSLPDEVEFAKLINHWEPESADVAIMDPLDWDSKGQYTGLLEAVRQAGKGNDVRVYRVAKDRSRVEYWLVTTAEGRIVGTKALAVES